jgi:hypothetical protein
MNATQLEQSVRDGLVRGLALSVLRDLAFAYGTRPRFAAAGVSR